MCRHCRKLLPAKLMPKPEIYLGEKKLCGYCEQMNHLYSTKKSHHKVCKGCKEWLEKLPFLDYTPTVDRV
ncbi:MAG TPA: hypothetical protein VF220_05445 [Nitrososphaeraceae archaeon]